MSNIAPELLPLAVPIDSLNGDAIIDEAVVIATLMLNNIVRDSLGGGVTPLEPLPINEEWGRLFKSYPKWNNVKEIRFLSLFTYRADHHDAGVAWWKRTKASPDAAFLGLLATQCSQSLQRTFGNLQSFTVTAPPRGHSKGGTHFASELAKAVAGNLKGPYEALFVDRALSGVHGPWDYANRKDMKLHREVADPVLLIDDIATTGTTLQGCMTALKGCCVIPVVIVYGDVG